MVNLGKKLVTESSELFEDYQVISGERFTLNKDELVRREYSKDSIKESNSY